MPDKASIWSVNPIALAELITGVDLDPFLDKDPSDPAAEKRFRDVLEAAFGTRLEAIFEAAGDEPARLDLFQKLADSTSEPVTLTEIEQNPLVRTMITRYKYSEDAMKRVLPYLVPVKDATFTLPGAAADGDTDIGSWQPVADRDYVVSDVSFLDPRQGPIADCYLISSMISLAWARPAEWTAAVTKTKQTYSYTFFDGADQKVKDLNPTLPYNKKDKLAYARSSTSPLETWPAMFEKAYVMYMLRLSSDPKSDEYLQIEWGEPQVACSALVGSGKHYRLNSGDVAYSTVKERCGNPDDGNAPTSEPTMAWTPKDLTLARGHGWKETGLLKRHSYAVLGIMRLDSKDFVVLRDPHGKLVYNTGHPNGQWKPGRGAPGAETVNLNAYGVFALRKDLFDACFEGIGWVQ